MQDHSDVKWDLLVQEMAQKTSKSYLARELGVHAKEVNRWICDPATKRARVPHHSNRDAILRLAEKLKIRWRRYSELIPAFDFGRSFPTNKSHGPQALSFPPTEMHRIPTSFLGHELNSPVGLSASLLTADSNWIADYAQRGFDILTYNTVRSSRTVAHVLPNVLYIESVQMPLHPQELGKNVYATPDPPEGDICGISLTSSFGVPSADPEEWKRDIGIALQKLSPGQILVVSVLGTESQDRSLEDDFVFCATLAHAAGAHVIELNFGCRIVFKDQRSSLSHELRFAKAIAERVRAALPEAKLLIKIDFLGHAELEQLFDATFEYVDGYTALTPVPMPVMTRGQLGDEVVFFSQNRANPGVSGAAIRFLALNTIQQLAELKKRKPSLVILATGGISTAEHARDFLEAGANVVQIATAAIFNPSVAIEIRSGLAIGDLSKPADTLDGFRFSDETVRKAHQRTIEVCRESNVPLDVGFSVLYANWLNSYKNDVARLGQSGDPQIRTRRSVPQKHQLREWISRAQKSRK
jgi:dihydroorotate dehydrogenase (NAD+) catalytic subunit